MNRNKTPKMESNLCGYNTDTDISIVPHTDKNLSFFGQVGLYIPVVNYYRTGVECIDRGIPRCGQTRFDIQGNAPGDKG